MRVSARIIYGFILQLHPYEFRTEFNDEMLWIFDEQMGSCEEGLARVVLCAQLLLDAFRSAFIQRALREQQQPETIGLRFDQIGPSTCVIHVAEGGFIVLACLFSVFSIVLCLRMVMSSL
jgi:hypothetical protein